jgi:hypothetical protein
MNRLLVAAAALSLAACDSPMAPTQEAPVTPTIEIRPEFTKSQCHNNKSSECYRLFIAALTATGVHVRACGTGVWGCVLGAGPDAIAWIKWADTPDADGCAESAYGRCLDSAWPTKTDDPNDFWFSRTAVRP